MVVELEPVVDAIGDHCAMSFPGHVVDVLRQAEDEARMLGWTEVEPEHVLLAACRSGHGRDLLVQRSVAPRDVHGAVVQLYGEGDGLLLGRLPQSRRSQGVLERAVTVAAQRGEAWPGDVELLLALAADERAVAVLEEVGVGDLAQLIEQEHPRERDPLDDAAMRRVLVSAALDENPRPRRLSVPANERFSSQARRVISAAAEMAARLEHREVAPFHLLLGCLQVSDSVGAQAIADLWAGDELGTADEAVELARRRAPHPSTQATGIFTEPTRRVIAEDALALAYRHGHHQITTGHLLLAVLDSGDPPTSRLTWPRTQQLARTLIQGLPGAEHDAGPDDELEWIDLHTLMRMLAGAFRRVLPEGWVIRGSARGDIHLQVPGTHSESDFQIRPGWITAQPGPGSERLQQVAQWMLERFQAAVSETTGRPWPPAAGGGLAAAHAHVIRDRYNPRLQLGYGDPDAPVLRIVEHGLLIHMMVRSV